PSTGATIWVMDKCLYQKTDILQGVFRDDRVVVTDGNKSVIYTLNMQSVDKPDNTSSLDFLSLSVGTLSPAFRSDVLNYSVELPFGTSFLIINATKTDKYSTVTDGPVSITGPGTINVVVTAVDGIATTTYTINVSIATSVAGAEVP